MEMKNQLFADKDWNYHEAGTEPGRQDCKQSGGKMASDFRWWFRQGCYFGASLIVVAFGVALVSWANIQQDPFRVIVGLVIGAAVVVVGVGLFFAFAAPIASRISNVLRSGR
jgi:hypothetical protein